MEKRSRKLSDVLKRGYSDEEVSHVYELGRLYLESGDLAKADSIFQGIVVVAPDFWPAWLGLSYIAVVTERFDQALNSARSALRVMPDSVEAVLFLVSSLISSGDFNTAGSYLGEIAEKIESGGVDNPNVIRFYRAQLARYENRT
ncbi:MAG: hypothetical protein KDD53_09945 [Bdellovibrionales bacterium]|nr:hypothetical protein [Bdellovibrionales bacterium]